MPRDRINICSLFRQTCLICAINADPHSSICQHCREELPWITNKCYQCGIPLPAKKATVYCPACTNSPPIYDSTHVLFEYRFPVNLIISHLKSAKGAHHIHWLSALIIRHRNNAPLPQSIIPVPISRFKNIMNGYNQSAAIARRLADILNISYRPDLVKKVQHTLPQAKLSANERKRNLHNVFQASKNRLKHVAVIDDVITTGTTANEVARALKKTGVEFIEIWAIARTPLPLKPDEK